MRTAVTFILAEQKPVQVYSLKPVESLGVKTTVGIRVVLLLIGIVTTGIAILGIIQGSVYCKGGPFSRATRPVAFWASIIVYLFWSVLMGYFLFFRHG